MALDDRWRKRMPKALALGAVAAIPFGAARVAIYWASVYGPRWLQIPGVELLTFPTMFAAVLLPLALLGVIVPQIRGPSIALSLVAVTFVFSDTVFSVAADRVRIHGFRSLASDARPVVAAIREYQVAHGRPPAALDDLPPHAVQALRALPRVHYLSDAQTPERYDGNLWVLSFDAGTGFLNWDQFLYYPLQNYPRQGHGGSLQPIEEWAYVHE